MVAAATALEAREATFAAVIVDEGCMADAAVDAVVAALAGDRATVQVLVLAWAECGAYCLKPSPCTKCNLE